MANGSIVLPLQGTTVFAKPIMRGFATLEFCPRGMVFAASHRNKSIAWAGGTHAILNPFETGRGDELKDAACACCYCGHGCCTIWNGTCQVRASRPRYKRGEPAPGMDELEKQVAAKHERSQFNAGI